MKRISSILTVVFALILLGVVALHAQQAAPSGEQSANQNASTDGQGQPGPGRKQPERWRYDPGAKRGADNGNCTPEGLKKINPDDVNYGGLLANWRVAVVQETVYSIQFWLNVTLFCMVGLCLFYIHYLHRQREQRLAIAGDIVTQLTNMYLDARDRVLELTEIYSKMVEEENVKVEGQQAAADAQHGLQTVGNDPSTRALQSFIGNQSKPAQGVEQATVSQPDQTQARGNGSAETAHDTAASTQLFDSTRRQQETPVTAGTGSSDLGLNLEEEDGEDTKGVPLTVLAQRQYGQKQRSSTPQGISTEVLLARVAAPEPFPSERQPGAKDTPAQPTAAPYGPPEGGATSSQAETDLRAELERTKAQLSAREQQVHNQRLQINQLVDAKTTLVAENEKLKSNTVGTGE